MTILTAKERESRRRVLHSTRGLLVENPLSFDSLITFGVIPQQSNSSKADEVFKKLLDWVCAKSRRLIFEPLGKENRVAFLNIADADSLSFFSALQNVGDDFDVLVYSEDPSWAIIVTAGDRVVVFGGERSSVRDVLDACGGLSQIWSAAKETLSEPAFSEPFWRQQRSGLLTYDRK
jgi:hypothetical protein